MGSIGGSCLQDGAFLSNGVGFYSLEPSGIAAGSVMLGFIMRHLITLYWMVR